LSLMSKNPQKPTVRPDHVLRAQRLFSMIAPIYDLMLARSMTRVYRKAIDLLLQTDLNASGPGHTPSTPPAPTALDVGTGTGLFASELARRGFQVTAIDSCSAMLQVARRHRPRAAHYIEAEAHLASRQPGAPFDIVCAGMLLHGLPREYRIEVLADVVRAARKTVMIVDYIAPGNLITTAVERLEGSYYRDFLHEFSDDLACAGADALVYPLTGACALYLVPISPRPQSH
jgi:ubiquinone/menaquinone biosynthesis C-methylase UbiE